MKEERGRVMMKNKGISEKINRHGYLFIAPFVATFIVFNLYPIIYTFQLSFYKWKGFGKETFVGFENFWRLLTDSTFPKTLINTLKIWLEILFPSWVSPFFYR